MHARNDEHVTAEAAEWLLKLEEDCGPCSHAEFVGWLKRSPHHMDEFLMVEAAYRTVHQVQAVGTAFNVYRRA